MTRWLLVLTVLWPLVACSGSKSSDTVAVPVSAINYTGDDLNSFLFIHPQTGKPAGGPSLGPYEAGGTMCCYSLPKKWHPGIKVTLRWDWWQGDDKPRLYQERVFEVPPYAGGEPGMLWAVFYGGDDVEVVVSNVDPGHPDWPGRLKHWPKPTLEYKRKLWQEEWDRKLNTLTRFERRARHSTEEELKASWEFSKQYEPQEISNFTGPDDPRFREFVRNKFKAAAEEQKKELEYWESRKP